jgi:hypothetical protein
MISNEEQLLRRMRKHWVNTRDEPIKEIHVSPSIFTALGGKLPYDRENDKYTFEGIPFFPLRQVSMEGEEFLQVQFR